MTKLKSTALVYTDEDAMEYMKQWINQETWDDFAIMYNSGDVELFAEALVRAGAINSEECYEECQEIEAYIEQLANNFKKLPQEEQRKRYEELLKEVITVDCKDCNHVSFVANSYEVIYPELLVKCWDCDSQKIDITFPIGYNIPDWI